MEHPRRGPAPLSAKESWLDIGCSIIPSFNENGRRGVEGHLARTCNSIQDVNEPELIVNLQLTKHWLVHVLQGAALLLR